MTMKQWFKEQAKHLLFLLCSKDEVEKNRLDTEKLLNKHWSKIHRVHLNELIQERWNKPAKGGKQIDDYNYVVFIDCEGDLDWVADDENSKEKIQESTSSLIAKIMDAESYPTAALNDKYIKAYKRMLGHAIVSAFENDRDSALSLYDHALQYLQRRVSEKSRFLTLAISTFLATLIGWSVKELNYMPLFWGLIGAYLSIVQRSVRRSTDANAGFRMHFVEVLVFLVAGMILGYLGVVILNSDIVPQLLKPLAETCNGEIIMAVAAGMLQGMIPSMIGKYFLSSQESSK